MSADQPTRGTYDAKSKWVERPFFAAVLRAVVSFAPTVASFLATHFLSRSITPETLGLPKAFWWVLIISVGVIVLIGVDRAMRVFLPLVALFKLSLVFPDQAPSRFRLAMRTGTTKSLERKVAEVKANGLPDDESQHAELLLQMVAALSHHDRLTRGHCERVRAYTDMIAEEMGLGEEDASKLRWAALLHDVGKLFVPAEILNKEGRPTETEWDILKSHAWQGERLVGPLRPWLGEWAQAVGSHHERWDGDGYPRGTDGADIQLGARIVAVADTFDVITSKRSYKEPISAAQARAEIARCAGSQFDPAVVRAFLNIGIGRLKFAIGPLSWLANMPAAGQASIAPLSSPIATAAVAIIATGAAVGTNNIGLLIQQNSAPETLAYSDEVPEPIEEVASGLIVQDVSLTLSEDTTTEGTISFTTTQGQVTLRLDEETSLGRIEMPLDVSAGLPGVERTDGFAFTYSPSPDRYGSETIPFEVCDLDQKCTDGRVRITVTAVNDTPTIEAMADLVVRPGRRISLSPRVRDVENDPIGFTITGLPAGVSYDSDTGTISGRISSSAESGRYRVTVVAAEKADPEVSATTSFELVIPNAQIPDAIGYPVSTPEDTAIRIDLPGDTGGESLAYSIVAAPQNGSVGRIGAVRTTSAGGGDQAASITYTPSANYFGNDEFGFQICNRDDRCSRATIRVSVTPVNDPPFLSPLADLPTLIGGTVSVPIVASDVEGTPSITVTGLPAWLGYSPAGRRITGTVPNGSAGYATTITVRATDSTDPNLSATRTFRLSVAFANPRANQGALSIDEDSPGLVTLGASTESGALTFSIPPGQAITGQATFPNPLSIGQSRGTRSGASSQLRYAPAPDFSGTEYFDYRVCDSDGRCDTATVDIVVNPVNDSPRLGSLSYSIDEDATLDVARQTVLDAATDPEGDPLSLSWRTPTNGSVQGLGSLVRFTPDPDFIGPATIDYQVCDDRGGCAVGQVLISVTAVNDAPVLSVPGAQTIHLGDTVSLTATATDVDGDAITYLANDLPTGLSIDPATGVISGTVDNNLGQGSFTSTIKADDGTVATSATVEFTVATMVRNLTALTMTTPEDTPGIASFEGATDYATITFSVLAGPAHGTVTNLTPSAGNGVPFTMSPFFGNFDYDPAPDYHGPDSVTIEIRDQATNAVLANLVVPLTVSSVNDAPVVVPMPDRTYDLGEAVSISVSASDVDGDTLTYSAIGLPPGLTIDTATGVISGTLATNSTETGYHVEVDVDDGTIGSPVSFQITLVQPAILPGTISMDEDTVLTVQIDRTIVGSINVTVLVPPSYGTISNLTTPLGDGTLTFQSVTISFDYTPAPNTFGPDQVTIRRCNTVVLNICTEHVVNIVVQPINDAPEVAAHSDIPITSGSEVSDQVVASDPDGDALIYSATNLPPGLAIDPDTGEISGAFTPTTPPAHYDTTVTVTDSGSPALSDSEVFRFVVN